MEAHVKMEAQNLPCAKIARFGDTTGMVSIASPSIGLGLGLGPRKSGFTFLQLQELEHQALIFKYMVAGVPVPFHLVLPIWKSVVSSSGGIYQHHPSYISCSSFCFDCRNNMEPEPGRCRRTDGKKWRCSKDVVLGQKYCERHMHRGRHRSRKPVEGHLTTTNTIDSNTHLSISIPVGLELMTSNTTTTTTPTTTTNNNTRLGFSPTSVLQSRTVKTEPCS